MSAHSAFIYHPFVTPLGGTTALYTSMYGMGMIALLPYTTRVMKERISRLELFAKAGLTKSYELQMKFDEARHGVTMVDRTKEVSWRAAVGTGSLRDVVMGRGARTAHR